MKINQDTAREIIALYLESTNTIPTSIIEAAQEYILKFSHIQEESSQSNPLLDAFNRLKDEEKNAIDTLLYKRQIEHKKSSFEEKLNSILDKETINDKDIDYIQDALDADYGLGIINTFIEEMPLDKVLKLLELPIYPNDPSLDNDSDENMNNKKLATSLFYSLAKTQLIADDERPLVTIVNRLQDCDDDTIISILASDFCGTTLLRCALETYDDDYCDYHPIVELLFFSEKPDLLSKPFKDTSLIQYIATHLPLEDFDIAYSKYYLPQEDRFIHFLLTTQIDNKRLIDYFFATNNSNLDNVIHWFLDTPEYLSNEKIIRLLIHNDQYSVDFIRAVWNFSPEGKRMIESIIKSINPEAKKTLFTQCNSDQKVFIIQLLLRNAASNNDIQYILGILKELNQEDLKATLGIDQPYNSPTNIISNVSRNNVSMSLLILDLIRDTKERIKYIIQYQLIQPSILRYCNNIPVLSAFKTLIVTSEAYPKLAVANKNSIYQFFLFLQNLHDNKPIDPIIDYIKDLPISLPTISQLDCLSAIANRLNKDRLAHWLNYNIIISRKILQLRNNTYFAPLKDSLAETINQQSEIIKQHQPIVNLSAILDSHSLLAAIQQYYKINNKTLNKTLIQEAIESLIRPLTPIVNILHSNKSKQEQSIFIKKIQETLKKVLDNPNFKIQPSSILHRLYILIQYLIKPRNEAAIQNERLILSELLDQIIHGSYECSNRAIDALNKAENILIFSLLNTKKSQYDWAILSWRRLFLEDFLSRYSYTKTEDGHDMAGIETEIILANNIQFNTPLSLYYLDSVIAYQETVQKSNIADPKQLFTDFFKHCTPQILIDAISANPLIKNHLFPNSQYTTKDIAQKIGFMLRKIEDSNPQKRIEAKQHVIQQLAMYQQFTNEWESIYNTLNTHLDNLESLYATNDNYDDEKEILLQSEILKLTEQLHQHYIQHAETQCPKIVQQDLEELGYICLNNDYPCLILDTNLTIGPIFEFSKDTYPYPQEYFQTCTTSLSTSSNKRTRDPEDNTHSKRPRMDE